MEPDRVFDGPRVSVIMPCRNGLPFLVEALGSLQAQTYENWELLFVDGASTDGSVEAVVAMFPDVYAYPPEPGDMPVFHQALSEVPISVRLIEPEYSPRYLWLDLTVEHLREAGADVQVRFLRQARAGFHFEPDPTAMEIETQSTFPALLRETLATMERSTQCTKR